MDHHFCQKAAQSIRPLLWQHWKRGQVFRQIAQGLRKQNAIDVTDSDSWNVNGCGCLRIKLPKPGCPRENVFPRRVRSKAALGESVPPELGNVLSIGRKEAVAGDTQVLSARHIDRVWGAEPKMEFDPFSSSTLVKSLPNLDCKSRRTSTAKPTGSFARKSITAS